MKEGSVQRKNIDGFDLFRSKTPTMIKSFLNNQIKYDAASSTCKSVRRSLIERRANCVDGALLAAAALQALGHPPLIMDLEAKRDDDHVIAVYKLRGHWGAISKSNCDGLGHREAVYRTLRELVLSYFDFYTNGAGKKALRSYSRPINLRRFNAIDWLGSDADLWEIPSYLTSAQHFALLSADAEKNLSNGKLSIMRSF
jgi:hypothetical protein